MPQWNENLYRVEVRDEDGCWVTWCDRHTMESAQKCFEDSFVDFEVSAARIVDMETDKVVESYDIQSQHS